jgi:uncharacterized metal-binding protein YceD (DUF177 family)
MSMQIRLESLKDGPQRGEVAIPGEFARERLGPDFSVREPLLLRWRAQMVAQLVEVKLEIEGALAFACSRCADPLTLPVALHLEHRWLPAAELADAGADAVDGDDPDLSPHDGVVIDLSPVVLDAIVVEVPLAPDCTDAREGRCPTWSEAPIVYHAGGPPPEDDGPADTVRPFAAALAALRAAPDDPAEA